MALSPHVYRAIALLFSFFPKTFEVDWSSSLKYFQNFIMSQNMIPHKLYCVYGHGHQQCT